MGPLRHASGDLRVDVGDLGRVQPVLLDQLVVNLLQTRRIEVDPEGRQAPLHPGQVPVPSKHLPAIDGRDLIDAVTEKKSPVVHRDESLLFRDVLAVEIDNAHGVGFLGFRG